MKKLMVVMHMSGAYAEQTFYKEKKEGWQICQITCQDIEGTNCYCDDAAKESLRERVRAAADPHSGFRKLSLSVPALAGKDKRTFFFDLI